MRRWHQDKKTTVRIDIIPAFGIKTHLPSFFGAEATAQRENVIPSPGAGDQLQLNDEDVVPADLFPRLLALGNSHPQLAVTVKGDSSVQLQAVIEVMAGIEAAGFQSMSVAVQKKPPP